MEPKWILQNATNAIELSRIQLRQEPLDFKDTLAASSEKKFHLRICERRQEFTSYLIKLG